MTDDGHVPSLRLKRRPRGPFIITNPSNDSDEEQDRTGSSRTPPWYHPQPPSQSPFSEPSIPSTSYTSASHIPYHKQSSSVEQTPAYANRSTPSNPSLSSPSGSSSPAVESTPPPSTPGHSVAPTTSISGVRVSEEIFQGPGDDGQDARHQASRGKQHIPACLMPARPSANRPATSPTTTHMSPTYSTGSREQPLPKVLLMLTSDCENYSQLDISGARDAAYIKEKMFTKLQISDDQQPFFSIFKTDIGSFALSDSLSDDRLLEVCREEGDGKGTLKFLVQHSSANLHVQPMPPRHVITNHIPPVLPDQESFRSPSNRGGSRSVRSNFDSRSSTSEHYYPEVPFAGQDGSVSEDEHLGRDIHRNTIRPSQQAGMPRSYHPPSPLDRRRMNHIRDPSPPAQLSLSPGRRGKPAGEALLSPLPVNERAWRITTPTSQQFSPSRPYDDGTSTMTPSRKATNNSISDAEGLEKMGDRDTASRMERLQSRTKYDDSKRSEEAWVVVNKHDGKRSGSNTSRIQQGTGGSHPSTNWPESNARYNNYHQQQYANSRTNLPLPPHPRNAPPAIPTSRSGSQVPPHWALKGFNDQRLQPSKSARLQAAKSMDNLRGLSSPGVAQRKPSQTSMSRPSVAGLRETATSSGSFINMDKSPPPRQLGSSGIQSRANQDRGFTFSPTGSSSRAPPPPQIQSDISITGTQLSYSSKSGSGHIQTPSSSSGNPVLLGAPVSLAQRKLSEEPHPRPRSALDDIGASPGPSRTVRPLPSTGSQSGSSSWIDVEAVLDEDRSRITSPHPYAAVNVRPSTSGSTTQSSASHQSSRQGSVTSASSTIMDSSSSSEIPSGMSDSTIVQPPRSMRVTQTMERPSIDSRPEQPKSFVNVDESPIYDADAEGNSTLKADHAYLLPMLTGSSGEGTLKQGLSSQMDKPLPVATVPQAPVMSEATSAASFASAMTEGDEYEDEFDDTASLWQIPRKSAPAPEPPNKPALVVNTDNAKTQSGVISGGVSGSPAGPLTGTRSPAPQAFRPTLSGQEKVPPSFPPPNFPPPPPPILRHKGRGRDKPDTSKRDSQFVKSSNQTWAFRPTAEGIYDSLDAYFPDHDLDKPVIDQTTGGTSPTSVEPIAPPLEKSASEKERDRRFNKKKSIRIVAEEHKRKIEDRISRANPPTTASILRKRSTKLWGSKVEEVTPFQVPGLPPPVPESPTATNIKPIFKWVRGELIGRGTYGRVYLALNATTGEMIAVKQVEIPKTDSDRGDSRQTNVVDALKMESETLKDLDHPNIVQYLGFEQTPDFLSIFLEYVPGGSVAGVLRKHGKFEDQTTRSFTAQILSGLEYLHNNRIIHRDLKADNILVDPSGICKISDFGISKRTTDIEENGIHTSMQGSLFWMAPEVVQAARKGEQHGYNGKVDIWSLGCVVLEMWAGRRPWQDVDAFAVIYELITNQVSPPVPPDVTLSPEADDFRQRCFAIKPDERPSATELRKHPYLLLRPDWTFTGFR